MSSSLFTIARIYLNIEFRKHRQTPLNLSSKLAKISQSTKRFRSHYSSLLFNSPDIHWDSELDPTKKNKNNQKETMATSKQSNLNKNNKIEQVYEYLLVLDFEATCDQGKIPEPQVRIN